MQANFSVCLNDLLIVCISAGEYNLRLGIMKELHPDMVATHQGVLHIAIACQTQAACSLKDASKHKGQVYLGRLSFH